MKGILMLLVIINHFWHFKYTALIISSFHMAAFMFLSGYLFSLGKQNKKYYLCKYISRYGKPYLFTFGIVIIYGFAKYILMRLMNGKDGDSLNELILEDIKALFFSFSSAHDGIKAVGVIWFLCALMFASLVMLYMCTYVKKIWIQGIIVASFFGVCRFLSIHFIMPEWIFPGGAKFLVWMWGGYIYRKLLFKYEKIIFSAGITLYVIMLLNCLFFKMDMFIPVLNLCAIAPILGLSYLAKYIENKEWFVSKFLTAIGQNTLTIMCVHCLGITFINSLWIKMGMYNTSSPYMMLIRLVGTICISYVYIKISKCLRGQ